MRCGAAVSRFKRSMHPLQPEFANARRTLADHLGAQVARYLVERMAARELESGQTLVRQHAAADALYFVLGGRLGVYVGEPESRVAVIEPGSWVGEVSFVDPGPASATVRAEQATLLLEMRNRDIDLLTDDAPHVAAALLSRLCRELAERVSSSGAPPPPPDAATPTERSSWRSWWPRRRS